MRFYDGVHVPAANGLYCRTYKTKMFTVAGSVLYFSAVGAADDWAGTGSGFIDLSLEDSDMTDCLALEVYYDKLAILSSTATQLWQIDPDPLQTPVLADAAAGRHSRAALGAALRVRRRALRRA